MISIFFMRLYQLMSARTLSSETNASAAEQEPLSTGRRMNVVWEKTGGGVGIVLRRGGLLRFGPPGRRRAAPTLSGHDGWPARRKPPGVLAPKRRGDHHAPQLEHRGDPGPPP